MNFYFHDTVSYILSFEQKFKHLLEISYLSLRLIISLSKEKK